MKIIYRIILSFEGGSSEWIGAAGAWPICIYLATIRRDKRATGSAIVDHPQIDLWDVFFIILFDQAVVIKKIIGR